MNIVRRTLVLGLMTLACLTMAPAAMAQHEEEPVAAATAELEQPAGHDGAITVHHSELKTKAERLKRAGTISIVGISVVMSILVMIAVVTGLLNKWQIASQAKAARKAEAAVAAKAAAAAPAAASASGSSEIEPKAVAAIAGAVAAVFGATAKIQSIQLTASTPDWGMAGRRTIQSTRRPARQRR